MPDLNMETHSNMILDRLCNQREMAPIPLETIVELVHLLQMVLQSASTL